MHFVARLIRTFAASLAITGSRAEAALGPLVAEVTVDSSGGKNYIVEILVTLALFGLALWVICKSSRRV